MKQSFVNKAFCVTIILVVAFAIQWGQSPPTAQRASSDRYNLYGLRPGMKKTQLVQMLGQPQSMSQAQDVWTYLGQKGALVTLAGGRIASIRSGAPLCLDDQVIARRGESPDKLASLGQPLCKGCSTHAEQWKFVFEHETIRVELIEEIFKTGIVIESFEISTPSYASVEQ